MAMSFFNELAVHMLNHFFKCLFVLFLFIFTCIYFNLFIFN